LWDFGNYTGNLYLYPIKLRIMKNDRIILDTQINNTLKLAKFTSQGLTPYYFNDAWGKDFGLVKITAPISGRAWDNKTKRVFLLNDDEYATMVKLVDNIREIIELSYKKIGTLKELIPATMNTLMNKTDNTK
jgi:hypothetical protein